MIPDTIRCIECEKLLDPATKYLTCEGCRIMCMRTYDCTAELSPTYAEQYAYCPDCESNKYECEYCGGLAFMNDDACYTCESYALKEYDKYNYHPLCNPY